MRHNRLYPALCAAAIAAAALPGCGGASGSNPGARPNARAAGTTGAAGPVAAEPTRGLLGPAIRSTSARTRTLGVQQQLRIRHKRSRGGLVGVAGEATCPDSGLMPGPGAEGRLRAAVVCLLNAQRAAAGLPSLSTNTQLAQAAGGMGQQMVSLKFFSHTTPNGTGLVDRVRPTGYMPASGDWVLGENLAWGSGALSTPAAIVQGWMNSPGHRANVLAPDYRDVGMGVVMGSPSAQYVGGTVYVADFGSRATAAASSSGASATSRSSGSGSGSGSTSGSGASGSRSGSGSRSSAAAAHNTSRVVNVPVRCRHACVVTTRVYWHHHRVGSGKRRLRHGGRARVRVHLSRRLHHARLTALTHVRGKRGTRRAVVRTP